MRRWLLGSLAAALLAGIATSAAASATSVSVTNPANGCKYTVYGPTIVNNGDPNPLRAWEVYGGVGETVSC